MKKRLKPHFKKLLPLAIPLAVLCALAVTYPQWDSAIPDNVTTIGKGFKPGTIVSYEVVSAEGAAETGREVADKSGKVHLPAINLTAPSLSSTAYNLKIEAPDAPEDAVSVSLRVNGETGKVSLKGTGWEQFAAVKASNGKKEIEAKADWAGIFDSVDAATVDDLKKNSFKVAFSNIDLSRDINRPGTSPIIEIQALEPQGQGGGPTSANVNNFTPTGDQDLSTFNIGAMNGAIANIVANFNIAGQMMGSQLSTTVLQQSQMMGGFSDARQKLETERKFQEASARAHSRYRPGEQMCRFGTFARSVAASEEKARLNQEAINAALMDRYLNKEGSSSGGGYDADMRARVEKFRTTYCDQKGGGLEAMCDKKSGDRVNRDVNFSGVIDAPLTLDIDFTDSETTPDEEDMLALAKGLYWPSTLGNIPESEVEEKGEAYLTNRHLIAVANVAHAPFASMVAAKSKSPASGAESGGAFIKAMMRELGSSDEEINQLLGDNPSSYAMMEVLTKSTYQNPNFYIHLQDTPANVIRIGTSIDAISLMQGRERFESSLRTEMLASQLLAQALKKPQEAANARIFSGMRNARPQ